MGILRWVVIVALLAWGNVADAFFGATGATVGEPATRGAAPRATSSW